MMRSARWLAILVVLIFAAFAVARWWVDVGSSRPARGVALGEAVPAGQVPAATPPARLVWFQKAPFGPVKIDPKTSHVVDLGRLERGTQVRAVVSVTFNRGVSNLTGTPDIDIRVEGPSGVVTQISRARNGTQLAFQTPTDGEYHITLGNEYSQFNAKQVSLQFLQP